MKLHVSHQKVIQIPKIIQDKCSWVWVDRMFHISHSGFFIQISPPLSLFLSSTIGQISFPISYSVSVPSHFGMRPLHITLPSSRWHVMVSAPCVLMKPSSHTTEMELPSWKLSPKRRAFSGTPGSGHSLRPKACSEKKGNKIE